MRWRMTLRARGRRVGRGVGIAVVVAVAALGPFLLRDLARGTNVNFGNVSSFEWASDGALLAVGERAAAWRRDLEAVVDRLPIEVARPGVVYVARAVLQGYSPAELAVLWPVVAARAGVIAPKPAPKRITKAHTAH